MLHKRVDTFSLRKGDVQYLMMVRLQHLPAVIWYQVEVIINEPAELQLRCEQGNDLLLFVRLVFHGTHGLKGDTCQYEQVSVPPGFSNSTLVRKASILLDRVRTVLVLVQSVFEDLGDGTLQN
jgi:hypothetical protein